tara:strand:- start:174 stop:359 length:186 start_codon:yes stop_codon:yes gene_type:complete
MTGRRQFAFERLGRACVKAKPKIVKRSLEWARQTSEKIVKEDDKTRLLANFNKIVAMIDAK